MQASSYARQPAESIDRLTQEAYVRVAASMRGLELPPALASPNQDPAMVGQLRRVYDSLANFLTCCTLMEQNPDLGRCAITGLLNREGARAILRAAFVGETKTTVVVLRVARLNVIQARYGSGIRDQVLLHYADSLVSMLTGGMEIFHWGPGMFVVVAPNSERDSALVVGRELGHSKSGSFMHRDRPLMLVLSAELRTWQLDREAETDVWTQVDRCVSGS